MQRALDFSKTPALRVPLPFFINVPVFGMGVGLLSTLAGPALFADRWQATTLAVTHLWTLGVLASAMLGALLQILAVACNVPALGIRVVARVVHPALNLGTLFLVIAFLTDFSALFILASTLLTLAFGLYLIGVGGALWHHRHRVYPGAREILVPVRGALLALALTVLLGIVLALSLARGHAAAVLTLANGHALLGLLGWGGLLLGAMSFQLLPIFQLTELYPRHLVRWGPLAMVALLALWLLWPSAHRLAFGGLVAGATIWGGVTWQRLRTRKRPSPEPTTGFWYLCTASTLAAAVAAALWGVLDSPAWAMRWAILLIVGVLGAAVNGMLYKIVPFLLWTHAQNHLDSLGLPPEVVRRQRKRLPRMTDYVNAQSARLQCVLYAAVIVSWTLAPGCFLAARLAGPLQLLSAAALAWNLGSAVSRFRQAGRTSRSLAAAALATP